MKITFFFFFVFVPALVFGQVVDKLYKQIEDKLNKDKQYLNIFNVSFDSKAPELKGISNIPISGMKKSFNFTSAEGTKYYIVFMKETVETDSLILLEVWKEVDRAAGGQSGFFNNISEESTLDTSVVLNFKDIQELYFNNRIKYKKIYNLVRNSLKYQTPQSMLGIKVDKKVNKSRGISGKNNQDFLNYAWVNGKHGYPKPKLKNRKSIRRRKNSGNDPLFQLDFSTAGFTFYNKFMNFGFSRISAEFSFSNDVLNLLPWQSMTMSGGIRTLISLSQNYQNLYDDFLIDARLLGRFRINTSSFASNIPNIFTDSPKLNVGPGIIVAASITRAYGLPFLNFYYSTGSTNVENPYVTIGTPDSSTAYFSFTQWETTMSFYWNTNENLTLRFRADIGIGRYNVIKAVYHNGIKTSSAYNQIQPVVKFNLDFVPKGNKLFSANFKWFDNIISLGFWLKFLEIKPYSVIRFEIKYISEPIYRSLRPWENKGSTMVGLRYRFGF